MGANIDQRAILEFSPLHTAVQFNEIEMSRFLIDFGADPECLSFYKETPLILAAKLGNSSMCESLIGNGANKDAQDMWNRTSLHTANSKDHAEVVRTLLECGVSQHIKNAEGDKVLESSLKAKNHNIFKTIMYH